MDLRKSILFLSLFFACCFSSFSQGRKLYPGQTRTRTNSAIPLSRAIAYPWTWNLGFGATSYNGQLNRTGALLSADNFQFNLGFKYRFTNRFSLGGNASYFRVSGDDHNSVSETGRPQRGLSFRSDCYQVVANAYFDFIPIITRFMGEKADQYERRNFFVPYGFVGIGVLYFNPQGKDMNGQYVSLKDKKTQQEAKTYSQFTPVANIGFGARIKISEFFDIGVDLTYTKTFTDYLDDIGGKTHYPASNQDPSTNTDAYLADPNIGSLRHSGYDPTNPSSSVRGGPKSITDGYFMVNFRIDYTMTSPFDFKDQKSHQHFGKGKGYKHHHFNTK